MTPYFCPRLFHMTHILHIDTSSMTSMVMLATNGKPVAIRFNETERDHAGSINRMIGEVLAEAGMDLPAIQAVAVCSGPGSYTGLRIGMATAKGICYALNKSLILLNRLELLAGQVNPQPDQAVFAILPARTGEYFMAGYMDNKILLSPIHATADTINNYLFNYTNMVIAGIVQEDIHIGNSHYFNKGNDIYPDHMARRSWERWQTQNIDNVATAAPLYLKDVFVHKKL